MVFIKLIFIVVFLFLTGCSGSFDEPFVSKEELLKPVVDISIEKNNTDDYNTSVTFKYVGVYSSKLVLKQKLPINDDHQDFFIKGNLMIFGKDGFVIYENNFYKNTNTSYVVLTLDNFEIDADSIEDAHEIRLSFTDGIEDIHEHYFDVKWYVKRKIKPSIFF